MSPVLAFHLDKMRFIALDIVLIDPAPISRKKDHPIIGGLRCL